MVKLFFRRFLSTSILLVFFIGVIFNFTPSDDKHLYQASLLKRDLLLATPSPRIIIFGGSNIAFGIDSEFIEEQMGIPVINYGLHVALGVAPLNEIRDHIQPGDIIIISLEYYNFIDETAFFGQPQYLADWVEFDPTRIWDVHDPYRQAPGIYLAMFQRKVNRQTRYYLNGLVYDIGRNFYVGGTSDKFNAYGDFIGHFGENSERTFTIPDTVYPINYVDVAYPFLEEFNQFAKSKGALVVYEAQAHRETNCEKTGKKNLDTFFRRIKNKTTIPLLTELDQLCLPDTYFYDTPYHLNEQGRRIRTERLVVNLQNALHNPK